MKFTNRDTLQASPRFTPVLHLLATAVLCSATAALASAEVPLGPPDEAAANHILWHAQPATSTTPGRAAIVALGSGMNHWSPTEQRWIASDPSFEYSEDLGFLALRVQQKCRLGADIASGFAFSTPEGHLIRGCPLAVALFSRQTGQLVIVGTLTNSLGYLAETNRLIYENCFSGICGSLIYDLERHMLEQNFVLTARLDPRDYGLPADDSTLIQVITELYECPNPEISRRALSIETNSVIRARLAAMPDLLDQTISFSPGLALNQGYAFTLPSLADTNGTATVVGKEFRVVPGTPSRQFLIESLPYGSVRNALEALPDCELPGGGQASVKRKQAPAFGYAAIPEAPKPLLGSGATHSTPGALASARKVPKGVTIDFRADVGADWTLFAANTNYIVASVVNLNTPVVMEPCVIKFKKDASLHINSTLTCKNSMNRPIIMTALDDSSAGEPLDGYPGYTGVIDPAGYANPAIYTAASSLSLSNFRFRYAKIAIQYYGYSGPKLDVSHSAFMSCVKAVQITGAGCGSGCSYVKFNNVLIGNTTYPMNLSGGLRSITISAYNCTINGATAILSGSWNYSVSFYSANSAFTYNSPSSIGTFSGSNNGFYGNYGNWSFGTSPYISSQAPYQNGGSAGNYYLAPNCEFRGHAATNLITSSLLAELRQRTVNPPAIISQTVISTNLALGPQVPREVGDLSIGYHYPPIDVALCGVTIGNATLAVLPGTVVAGFGLEGYSYGLFLDSGARLICKGLATNWNTVLAYNLIQEGTNDWSSPSTGLVTDSSGAGLIDLRFTHWAVPAQDEPILALSAAQPVWIRDCEFHAGEIRSSYPAMSFTNNLLERVYADIQPTDGNTTHFRNNLVLGGHFGFGPVNSVIADNLFDKAVIPNWIGGRSHTYSGGYNAYIFGCDRLQPVPSPDTDKILSASPSYQAGPFGPYYQLASGQLFRAGSTSADLVGLFDYCVITNLVNNAQPRETNGPVSIGYHYIAVDSSTRPADGNGNGFDDYLESSNLNQLPDWWLWKYFRHLDALPGDDSDGDGFTNLQEYENGTDPNSIVFAISVANDHVNTTTVNGATEVLRGIASRMAVLVNSTNFPTATWQSYNTSFTATLSGSDGLYEIWVGLSGEADDSERAWQKISVMLDTTPPLIVITNPLVSTTSRPMLQLQGYSTEPLTAVRFDVSNTWETVANQQGFVLHQEFNTNTGTFHTNYFQCFDIDLTNGSNAILLRATDLAGNTTTNCYPFTLDTSADTEPPLIVDYWPQQGCHVSTATFTARAVLDDPTAAVTAFTLDSAGVTNYGKCVIERTGFVWIEGLQMDPSADTTLTIIATDAAANEAATNITLHPGLLGLSIDPPAETDLHQSTLYQVTGLVAPGDYTVWVNGVPATNNQDGTWYALGVPVNTEGTAVFQARAIPNSDNGGVGTGGGGGGQRQYGDLRNPSSPNAEDCETAIDKPFRLYLEHHSLVEGVNWVLHQDFFEDAGGQPGQKLGWYEETWNETSQHAWQDKAQGAGSWSRYQKKESNVPPAAVNNCYGTFDFPATEWPNVIFGDWSINGWPECVEPRYPENCVRMEQFEGSDAYDIGGPPFFSEGLGQWILSSYHFGHTRSAHSTVKVFTGGKGLSHEQVFVWVYAWAAEILDPRAKCNAGGERGICNDEMAIGDFGMPDSDFLVVVAAPSGITRDATVRTPVPRSNAIMGGNAGSFDPQCVATKPEDTRRSKLGVGEEVYLRFKQYPPDLPTYETTAGSVRAWSSDGLTWMFTAPSNKTDSATVKARSRNAVIEKKFSIVEPAGVTHADRVELRSYGRGFAGAGMHIRPYVDPRDVSFYRVQVMEVGQPATSITGYFTLPGHSPPAHDDNTGANAWIGPLGQDNSWLPPTYDQAYSPTYASPWSSGSYTWHVPARWKIPSEQEAVHDMAGSWDQVFTLQADGTVTVRKFDQSVTRRTSEDRGTWGN